MTDTKSAAKPGQLKETERITQGAGPGRGPMGGGMVGQKASTFGPSAKRLVGQLRPQRLKVFLVLLLAVVSVALMSIGPRILGRATDLIFAGVLGRNIPEGVTQEQAAEALRAQGDVRQADLIANTDNLVPGQGVDFAAVGDVLMLVLAVYVVASLLAWLQGYILNDVVQATVRRMRADVEDKVNPLPLSYFDRQPRGELLSRVTNDIDNVSQSLQQTMSQLLTSLLTVVFVRGHDVHDLLAARARRAGHRAGHDDRHRRRHEAQPGHVHRPVASYRASSTPTSRRPSRATRWSRSSAARRRSSGPSPRRTTSSTRRRSAPSSSAG